MGYDATTDEDETSRKRRVEESALRGFLDRSSGPSGTRDSASSSSDIYRQPAFDEGAERKLQARASKDIDDATRPAGERTAPQESSVTLSMGRPKVSSAPAPAFDSEAFARSIPLGHLPPPRAPQAPSSPPQGADEGASPLERAVSWLKDRFTSGGSAQAAPTPAPPARSSPGAPQAPSSGAPQEEETKMPPLMMNLREGSPNPHVVAGRSTGYVKDSEAPAMMPAAKGFKSANLRLAYGGLAPEGDEPQAQPSPGVGDGPSSKTDVPEESARQKVVDPQQSTPAAAPQGQSPQGTATPGMDFLDRIRNLSPETKSMMIRLLGRSAAPVGSMNPYIARQFPQIAQGAMEAQKAQDAATEQNAKLPMEEQARRDAMQREANTLQQHREQLASTEKWRQAMEDYRRLTETEQERKDQAREQQARDALEGRNKREDEKEKAAAERAKAAADEATKRDAEREDRQDRRQDKALSNARWIAEHGTKTQGLSDKEVKELNDDLNENARKNPVIAKNQERVNAAGRVKALAQEANGDPRNLTPQQMQELAVSVNSLISGSSGGAAHEIDALVPKSGAGRVADIQQYILNQPRGANQQAFVRQMLETADREAQVAQSQIQDAHAKALPAHRHLMEKDPESFFAITGAHGFTPDAARAATQGKSIPRAPVVVESRTLDDGRVIDRMSDGTKRIRPNAS